VYGGLEKLPIINISAIWQDANSSGWLKKEELLCVLEQRIDGMKVDFLTDNGPFAKAASRQGTSVT